MSQIIDKYIEKFQKLRTDKSKSRWSESTQYKAPHKPLLLLSVIDLYKHGEIKGNLIELTLDLSELFTLYWSQVTTEDHRGNIILPFFHLRSDKFWHLIPKLGKESFVESVSQIRSGSVLRETVVGAKLDTELHKLLCIEKNQNILQTTLIKSYFSTKDQNSLMVQGKVNIEAFKYGELLLEKALERKIKDSSRSIGEYDKKVRDQGFRHVVKKAYNHRCAICGIRMLTADGHTVVVAAHIVPWKESHNDDPRNGIALCPLCHWTFDEGLVSISQQYKILLSPQISIRKNVPGHLITLTDRKILGPNNQALWPNLNSISWHQRKKFRRL